MKQWLRTVGRFIKAHRGTDLIALGASLATFATITLINAPRASIWFDEAFSAYIAQFSFWDIARYTATDVHPPLYYWLLKMWSAVFGTSELAYRSLSILFALAAIAVAFFLVRRLFGRRIAGVSLLFLTVSPMLIRYSDEARMYTLSTLLVFGATYLLVKAVELNRRAYWVWYGVLVALGMWTHYFTALAWIVHWIWWALQKRQAGARGKLLRRAVMSKEWVLAYGVAAAIFLPWAVLMLRQLVIVQAAGFWIGPVSIDTLSNYVSNVFYYLEHDHVQKWLALALVGVLTALALLTKRTYKQLTKQQRPWFLLIAGLAIGAPLILFLVSIPLPRSSFVERYLVPAAAALALYMAIVFVTGTQKWKTMWRIGLVGLVVGMMVFGISNVYRYGNYNKNSNTHVLTREVVRQAQASSEAGVPIVAADPWVFYEAVAYASPEHPVYFIDESTDYKYGSLDMLKDNDRHKIKDFAAFEKEHRYLWYIAYSNDPEVAPYRQYWRSIRTVSATDEITGKTVYKATLYDVSSEE